jgi:hypothetical protein
VFSRFIFLFLCGFALAAKADGGIPRQCGFFAVDGWIEFKNSKLELVIFRKSQNEVRLALTGSAVMQAFGYNNEPVSAKVTIDRPIQNQRGEAVIHQLKLRNPFGANPFDNTDGFTLQRESRCYQ